MISTAPCTYYMACIHNNICSKAPVHTVCDKNKHYHSIALKLSQCITIGVYIVLRVHSNQPYTLGTAF